MIQETIVTTQNRSGLAHIAPMGIHVITREGVYAGSPSGTGTAITRDGVYAARPSGTGAAITREGVYAASPSGTGTAITREGKYAARPPVTDSAIAREAVYASGQSGSGRSIARADRHVAKQPRPESAIARDGVNAAGPSGTGAAIARDDVNAAVRSGTSVSIASDAARTDEEFIILPFRPSTTLNNLLEGKTAVINYCDDVRIFAGCLTGRRNWALKPAEKIDGQVLAAALAHTEVELVRVEEDPLRPKLFCKAVHTVNHAPFKGFNRAQFSVLEAAILVSRLNMIPLEKIDVELDYLRIGLEKTAGDRELEAWGWLMKVVENYRAEISA